MAPLLAALLILAAVIAAARRWLQAPAAVLALLLRQPLPPPPPPPQQERPGATTAATSSAPPLVFLSHAGEEKKGIVDFLFQLLTHHYELDTVFLDDYSLETGTCSEPAMMDAIGQAPVGAPAVPATGTRGGGGGRACLPQAQFAVAASSRLFCRGLFTLS
jgi:hypothetical protein